MNFATKCGAGFVIAFAVMSAFGSQTSRAANNAEALTFDPFTRLTLMQKQIASLDNSDLSARQQKAMKRLERRLARRLANRHRLQRLANRMNRRMARIRVVSISAVVEPYNVEETSSAPPPASAPVAPSFHLPAIVLTPRRPSIQSPVRP